MTSDNVTNDVAQVDAKATTKAARKPKGGVPASIVAAAKTGVAATLADAIAKHLAISIDKKQFRDTLRRKHGYVSGKHGTKLTLSTSVARSMLDHYTDVKKRRSGK
jgi:hypothetical protein